MSSKLTKTQEQFYNLLKGGTIERKQLSRINKYYGYPVVGLRVQLQARTIDRFRENNLLEKIGIDKWRVIDNTPEPEPPAPDDDDILIDEPVPYKPNYSFEIKAKIVSVEQAKAKPPLASVGQVDAPQVIKPQSLRYRYTSHRASNFGSHFRNETTGVAWVYVKGMAEGFQMADGSTYNLSFTWEKEDSYYHISMFVNGRFDRAETYTIQNGQYKLMSITDDNLHTEYTHLNLYSDSIAGIAKSMINHFANRIHEVAQAQAETVTNEIEIIKISLQAVA